MTELKKKSYQRPRYGYKGTETALNGLTNWLYNNAEVSGTVNQQYQKYIFMIIEYAKAAMPDFKGRQKRPEDKARAIAKTIDADKKFNHFVHWIKKTHVKEEIT